MLVSEDFKRNIYATHDLPTLPIIAQKILMLRNDDEDLAEKLGSIISNDQSLSVKVLTLANSAYYGHRAQIGTIKKAVVVIGTSMLYRIRSWHFPGAVQGYRPETSQPKSRNPAAVPITLEMGRS